jgi:undecaprenyl-diphosphatase
LSALEAIVLGIVQGLTEYLPVSSSGHLRIVPAFFGWDDPGAAFTAVTQFGTMLAVVVYFWKDLTKITTTWLRSLRDPSLRGTLEARMGWYIGLGTIPIVVFGIAGEPFIEDGARSLVLIATMLIVLGVVLAVADRVGRKERDVSSITARDAAFIGFAQCLALIPGVSRSGATMTMGLFLGLERAAAARYSFLLSVPAVVLSGVYQLGDIGGEGSAPVGATIIATVLAFVSGIATIHWLLRFVANHRFDVFVVYRVLLGAVVLGLVAAGAIS